jgi:phosphoglucosamine mutase
MALLQEPAQALFGTDGVRGHANQSPMTVETALALGRALGVLLRERSGKHRVIIGKDTRISGYMIENALVAGLCSMGVDTYMVGPLPTPGVAYITRAYRADAGIVISASHNPFYDNGIKFFSSDGLKLNGAIQEKLERVIASGAYEEQLPADDALGKNHKIDDAQGRYIEYAKAAFPRHLSLNGMSIALDCAHGAAYRVAPLVFEELGAQVETLGASPNGVNINDKSGALHPELVAQMVCEGGAHVGIALDGDADRVILADETGRVVDGDVLLAICALDRKRRGELAKNGVVGTVMTNLGVVRHLEAAGIDVHLSKVGDRAVLEAMEERGYTLGGEQSGHMVFRDHATTGDGIVAALQVLRIMCEEGRTLSELASGIERFPQKLINVTVSRRIPIAELPEIAYAKEQLKDNGRVLVRYSGTEPKCRVMVEGEREQQVAELAQAIAEAVRREIGE